MTTVSVRMRGGGERLVSRVGKKDAGSISRCGESYGRAGFDSRNIKTTDTFGSVGGDSRSGKVTHRGSPGDEIRRASEERGSRSDRFLVAFRSAFFFFFCYPLDIIGVFFFAICRISLAPPCLGRSGRWRHA